MTQPPRDPGPEGAGRPGRPPSTPPTSYAVGVGPWVGPPPGDPRLDPELLAQGDRRNVADRFRYWRHEAIIADLDTRRHTLHVAVENWEHDFNIGSVIRTANAFNVAAFHIVGRRRWNRRGAMVTDRYQHEHHHATVAELVEWARAQPGTGGVGGDVDIGGDGIAGVAGVGDGQGAAGRSGIPLIGIDNLPGSVALETVVLPRACVLVFGQEGPGLSEGMRAACETVLHITQFGSTRSLNAGAAAAIAMHAWVRQHADHRPTQPSARPDLTRLSGMEPTP